MTGNTLMLLQGLADFTLQSLACVVKTYIYGCQCLVMRFAYILLLALTVLVTTIDALQHFETG